MRSANTAKLAGSVRGQGALALATLAFGVWYFGGLAPYGLHVGEDGDLLYEAFAVYRGQLPYVDFSTGYTPGYFYWHATLFRLFGVDALVVRVSTAIANILTLYLFYRLAVRLVPPALALLAPVLFLGGLPAYPGSFCPFNVPYPAWYNIPLWLGSMVALGTYVDHGRTRSLFLAALLAGVSFSMKPNVGLFNLVALSLFLLWWHAPTADDSRLTRWCWWALGLATIAGVLAIFGVHVGSREFQFFPLPVLAIAAILLINARRAAGRPGFLRAAAVLVLGFALPAVPWLLYFLVRLGLDRFLRDVFLLGSSYAAFFYIPHRALWTRWDLALLAVGAAVVLTPVAIRQRVLPAWLPIAGAAFAAVAGAAYVGLWAPMRGGFHSAVVTRVEDIVFLLLPAVNWCGIALVARDTTRDPHDRSALLASLVLLTVSGPAMALGMYPRSDYMHLLISAPGSIVLAVVLLGRVLELWQRALPPAPFWRWATVAMLTALPVVVSAVMMAPGVALAARLYTHYLTFRVSELTHLDLPSASLFLEPGSEDKLRPLRAVTRYVAAETRPDDYVFPFPNLPLLCFLTERLNPTPKGYFIAGYPDHAIEAEVVDSMRQRMPKLVLSLQEHQPFVTSASLYYFLIRDFVTAEFELTRQFGPYAVLRRRGEAIDSPDREAAHAPEPAAQPEADPTLVDETSWDELNDPSPDVQRAATYEIERRRDPAGAAALARRATKDDSPHRVLFLRIASQFSDERAVAAFLAIVQRHALREIEDGTDRSWATWEENESTELAASALYYIADKAMMEQYWLGSPPRQRHLAALREIDVAPLRWWLSDTSVDGRLRYAAAWIAGVVGDRESVPYLLTMLGSSNLDLHRAAAYALARLGQAEATADTVVSHLAHEDIFLPTTLIDLHRHAPAAVIPAIARGMQRGTPKQRETLSWIAAALHDPALLPFVDALKQGSGATRAHRSRVGACCPARNNHGTQRG